jgi:hypothetical protein
MDFLDYAFRKSMNIRKGSVEARRDKLSFLDELTPEQMACYRPDQIVTILRQREQVGFFPQLSHSSRPGLSLSYATVEECHRGGGV